MPSSRAPLPSPSPSGAVAGDNAVLFVDQHRVGEAKFVDRGGDLRDLLVAVRARVSGVGDQPPRTGAEQIEYYRLRAREAAEKKALLL